MSTSRTRIAALERQLRRQRRGPTRLDLVDAATAMELATGFGDDDVAEAWHRTREGMGVPDDGTGAGRIQRLKENAT